MRLAARRGRANRIAAIARKAKTPPRRTGADATLEHQAERATARAMRVHRDPVAASAAAHKDARAFTAGRDVYFAERTR